MEEGEEGGLATEAGVEGVVAVVGGVGGVGSIDSLGGRLGDGPFLWVTVDLRRGGSDGGSFSVVNGDGWWFVSFCLRSVVVFWCSGYSVSVIFSISHVFWVASMPSTCPFNDPMKSLMNASESPIVLGYRLSATNTNIQRGN